MATAIQCLACGYIRQDEFSNAISQCIGAAIKNYFPNGSYIGIDFDQGDVISKIKFGDCQTYACPTGKGFEKMLRAETKIA